jgi:hypothetical protein
MADRIIAGQNSPTSHDAINEQDASDILENKLTQLQSLLHCCYGDEHELFEAIGARHRGNLMWLGADLADDIGRLTQQLLKKLQAPDQQKA